MSQDTATPSRRSGPAAGAAAAGAPTPPRPDAIADRIVDAILAGRIAAGQRLGEQPLAELFGVSRTLVREALGRLSARGMVEVNARRGWYVVQPSPAEAKDAFNARIAIETGLVQALPGPLPAAAVRKLKAHVAEEKAAIRDGEPGRRSYLLGEFHVCLAECAGNALLAEILKDLTARTTLIASLFQSTHDAARSCADHAEIVAALEAGDRPRAAELVRQHIGDVARHLGQPAQDDPLAGLRAALEPPAPPPGPTAAKARRPRLFSDLIDAPLAVQGSMTAAVNAKAQTKAKTITKSAVEPAVKAAAKPAVKATATGAAKATGRPAARHSR